MLQRQANYELKVQCSQSLTPYHTRYESHTRDMFELNRQRFRQARILSSADYHKYR